MARTKTNSKNSTKYALQEDATKFQKKKHFLFILDFYFLFILYFY